MIPAGLDRAQASTARKGKLVIDKGAMPAVTDKLLFYLNLEFMMACSQKML